MQFCRREERLYRKVLHEMNIVASFNCVVLFCIGWLKWYEFSDVDFTSAVKLAEDLWTKPNVQIQWKFLIGLLYNAIYGGRIDNTVDLKVLKAYLDMYFVDEVLSHRWKPLNLHNSLPTSANYQVKSMQAFGQHLTYVFRNMFDVFLC